MDVSFSSFIASKGLASEAARRGSECQSNLPIVDAATLAAIEEMDPSLAEGHKVVFDRQCPVELRMQDSESAPQEMGTLDYVRCKILVRGDAPNINHIRFELNSENDLFFHYYHSIDNLTFSEVQDKQKLTATFSDYPAVLAKMINSCINEPQTFLALFVMHRNGEARLDFVQNMEYKFVELLSVEFIQSPEETVRRAVTFRYNIIKSKMCFMQSRLQDVTAILKIKNPALLHQLQKSSSARGAGGIRASPWMS